MIKLSQQSAPGRAITDAEIAAYARDGVVMLSGAFGLEWIELLRDAVDLAMTEPGPMAEEYGDRDGRFFGDVDMWQIRQGFRQFVMDSPAAEIAGRTMGAARVNFFYDQLLVKEPGAAAHTPWHQDQPYWAVSGRQVCSIWLPLDPVKKETAVNYVQGSHNWQAYNPHHFVDDSPYKNTGLPELPDIDANIEDYTILGWDMEPGDCLVFQAMIVHGAAGNLSSTHRRRALATRWTGDDARFVRRSGEVAIPTSDPGLAHGAKMDCDAFPLVWQRESGG